MAKVRKNTNILIRVTDEEKEILKKAALIEEKTLSTLTMEAAINRAKRIITKAEKDL